MLTDDEIARIVKAVARKLADDAEERRVQRAKERLINQCDGCQRGIPVNEHGTHVDPAGNWWNNQGCTASRYGHTPHGGE